jgi:hypothetical protein
MEILTTEQHKEYELKASEIAKQLGVSQVHPIVFVKEDESHVVAYLKEPTFTMKLIAKDKAMTHGVNISANELREYCLIKEHSDSLTYSDTEESDAYKLGICDYIISNMVTSFVNQFKKK